MKTKEEIEKEARWRFTTGHGAVDEYCVNVFIEACKWIQEEDKRLLISFSIFLLGKGSLKSSPITPPELVEIFLREKFMQKKQSYRTRHE